MRFLWLAALLWSSQIAHAQQTATVRFVTNGAAGGGMDVTTRMIAERLSKIWNTTFIVDYKPGANGIVGANLFKANNDPHTFLVADIGAAAINPVLMKNLPYEPRKDFVPVTDLFTTSFFFIARPERYDSFDKLVAQARANPGKLNYGSTGAGSGPRLSLELFKAEAGINLQYIPYKGNPDALAAVLSGDVDVAAAGLPAVRGHQESGKLVALATTGAAKSSVLPHVPTVAEGAKLKGFVTVTWVGLFASPKTPPEIVKRLQADVSRIMQDPEIVAFYRKSDYDLGGSPSAAFLQRIEADREKYRVLIQICQHRARVTPE